MYQERKSQLFLEPGVVSYTVNIALSSLSSRRIITSSRTAWSTFSASLTMFQWVRYMAMQENSAQVSASGLHTYQHTHGHHNYLHTQLHKNCLFVIYMHACIGLCNSQICLSHTWSTSTPYSFEPCLTEPESRRPTSPNNPLVLST